MQAVTGARLPLDGLQVALLGLFSQKEAKNVATEGTFTARDPLKSKKK